MFLFFPACSPSDRIYIFFHSPSKTEVSWPLAVLSLPPKYLFTLSFSHTFLPSEPGLGLPAEDVKSSQGAKATVNPQWLEKPCKNLQGPSWERRLTGRYGGRRSGEFSLL